MKENDRRFGLSKRQYRKLMRTIRHLFYQLRLWLQRRLKPVLRQRQGRLGRAGFVLPTAVIVLVIISLTVGALLLRTLNRTAEVAAQREQLQVLNATAPAVDRARAKLEYLFTKDARLPSGVPGEAKLDELLKDDTRYTLKDETRLDLNRDNRLDNAWAFRLQDGSVVAYSILLKSPRESVGSSREVGLNSPDSEKAKSLLTRNLPQMAFEASNQCTISGSGGGSGIEEGWYQDATSSAKLWKNFQIDAFVYRPRNGGETLATVEFIQERSLERGNKWGAWFRNDLEIFPGPDFRWNGSMHTEGSVIMGGATDRFKSYLISAPKSCVYTRTASEITAAETDTFQGQFIAGTLRDNDTNGSTIVHSYNEPPNPPYTSGDNVNFNSQRDSVNNGVNPSEIALNPVTILTEDRSEARG
ncbi:MAG: hypothetical protein ACK4WO_11970, partial [Thermosynechococcus sp.]